jgi:protein phosphatase 1 regulatory subunit 11
VNNEGLNRRSSKRCCIFHKKRDFGESSTDSDEGDHSDHDSISGSSSSGGGFSKGKSMCQKERGKIAHKRRNEKNSIPDFQRYHA